MGKIAKSIFFNILITNILNLRKGEPLDSESIGIDLSLLNDFTIFHKNYIQ